MRATVLALGDLGRSPRIQLHAKCLAAAGYDVDLVGFSGSRCWMLDETPGVVVRPISKAQGGSRLLRGVRLFIALERELSVLASPTVVLVQTPPAIPALWLAARFAKARGARAVFDWHNLGFSLLALRAGEHSAWMRNYKRAERHSARLGQAHLCVSEGLRDYLSEQFKVRANVFEDRPAQAFTAARPAERAHRRRELLGAAGLGDFGEGVVAISPTSWTLDEHLRLLEEAADLLEAWAGPSVAMIVSGAGELRAAFQQRLAIRAMDRVRIATVWLDGRDYARLLSGADVGMSFHASSSGIDFPMKIHDMRGAGLPVLALDFAGLRPRFVEGADGWAFHSAQELAQRLSDLPNKISGHAGFEPTTRGERWEDAWQRQARSVILGS